MEQEARACRWSKPIILAFYVCACLFLAFSTTLVSFLMWIVYAEDRLGAEHVSKKIAIPFITMLLVFHFEGAYAFYMMSLYFVKMVHGFEFRVFFFCLGPYLFWFGPISWSPPK